RASARAQRARRVPGLSPGAGGAQVVRDKDLPVPERRKARSRTARGGASARKRGAARLTVVEDPGTWEPSNSGFGDSGHGGEESGDGGLYSGGPWEEGPGGDRSVG